MELLRFLPDIDTDPTPGISKSPAGPTDAEKNIFSIVFILIPNTSPGPTV